jgi:hypothetical protein
MAEVVANGFVLLVAIVGHLLIVRAVINRGYELGLPQRVWQTLVTLLILIAVAGSIVIVRNAGLRGAMLIRGGAWSGLLSGWMIYLGVCITAFVVGVIVLVLRSRDSRVPAQISSKSDVLDYTQVASAATQANGAVGTLARLPGNQIFTVEIVQREVRLPRLPPQWDGLSILHITDLHMNGTPHRGFFEWAADRCAELNCDIATMTGDVMDTLEVIEWLPDNAGKTFLAAGQLLRPGEP